LFSPASAGGAGIELSYGPPAIVGLLFAASRIGTGRSLFGNSAGGFVEVAAAGCFQFTAMSLVKFVAHGEYHVEAVVQRAIILAVGGSRARRSEVPVGRRVLR
jgi:hypothetical protein